MLKAHAKDKTQQFFQCFFEGPTEIRKTATKKENQPLQKENNEVGVERVLQGSHGEVKECYWDHTVK